VANEKVIGVFNAIDQRMRTARFGLEDMKKPERAQSGLYNAVVFGRMVTFALQNLRNAVEGFDDWYSTKQQEMRSNPLLGYFHNLRTEIEKKADQHTMPGVYIKSFGPEERKKLAPPPPGATSLFLGDANGGSGWEIKRSDGSVDKYYIDLPPEIGEAFLLLPKAPEQYRSIPASELIRKYLDYLDELINEAKAKFAK
jgi:hypothetical protein